MARAVEGKREEEEEDSRRKVVIRADLKPRIMLWI